MMTPNPAKNQPCVIRLASDYINFTEVDASIGTILSGGRGSTPVYLEYRQHENNSITTFIETIRQLSYDVDKRYKFHTLHAVYDILYIPHDYILSEPPEEFNRMLEYVEGFRIDSKLLGYREIICQATRKKKRVYIPVYDLKTLPNFSPMKKYLSRKNSCNRVISQLEQINEVDYIIQIVLTVPHDLEITVKDFMKKIMQFIRRVEKELFDGDKLGGFYNIHIWSSEKPMEKHMHAHLLIPNAVMNSNGKLIRFKPYFVKRRLERLRKIWSDIIGKSAVIHVSYASMENRAKVVHMFRYASRHPLIDFAYYYVNNKFDEKDAEKIKEILEYNNRRVSFGWCRKLKQFVGEEKDGEEDRCPICGGKVVVRDVYELDHVDLIVFFDWKERKLKYFCFGFEGGGGYGKDEGKG